MKEKKVRNTIRFALFVILFIFLFVHVSYMTRDRLSHTGKNISGFYGMKSDSLDVVFVGASGCFTSFAPMDAYYEYGYTSYVYATNVMAADSMSYMLKEVMKTQSPKVLVIDTMPFGTKHTFEYADYVTRYNTDGLKYSLNRYNLIKDAVTDKDKLPYFFDIIKYHGNEFNWSNFWCETHSVDKGYQNVAYGVVKEPIVTTDIVPLDSMLEGLLINLLEECKEIQKEYGTRICFITFPYADMSVVNENYYQNMNYVEECVKQYGFDYIDCQDNRRIFNLDDSVDYWDAGHFNIFGAEKITSEIGEQLDRMYNLPDHRNDQNYVNWDNDMEQWEWNKADYKDAILQEIATYDGGVK